jgi:hypothetical protein
LFRTGELRKFSWTLEVTVSVDQKFGFESSLPQTHPRIQAVTHERDELGYDEQDFDPHPPSQEQSESFHESVLNAYDVRIVMLEMRVYGQIYLAATKPGLKPQSTGDWLNQDKFPLVPVAAANLYTAGIQHPPAAEEALTVLPAMVVRKQDILFLTGGRPAIPTTGRVKRRRVALMYPGFALVGSMDGPEGLPFQHYVAHSKPFQTLFKVELYPLEPGMPLQFFEPQERFEFVTLNLHQARAVFTPPCLSIMDAHNELTLVW